MNQNPMYMGTDKNPENNYDSVDDNSNDEDGSGIDGIIGMVDEYIADPTKVTRQTLTQLKTDLLDLKDYLDSENGDISSPSKEPNGLMIMIGRHSGNKGGSK